MATLTYDPTPADQPEFSPEEREAIAIGEQAEADQQQMLAGKFKDAEALEQAYIELQKKLGTNDADETDTPEQEVRDEEDSSEEEVDPIVDLLNVASEEYYNNDGTLSEDTINELSQLDSSDLIAAYIEMQGQNEQPQAVDLSSEDISSIYSMAGGEQDYNNLTSWASENLPDEYIEAFDSLVDKGDARMVQLAVAGLRAEYEKANGFEGQMLTGKAAQNKVDVFRSQAEVVEAMSDPRYDRDPAYRQDVFAKLERSPIQY
jgi:hypothetical protein